MQWRCIEGIYEFQNHEQESEYELIDHHIGRERKREREGVRESVRESRRKSVRLRARKKEGARESECESERRGSYTGEAVGCCWAMNQRQSENC